MRTVLGLLFSISLASSAFSEDSKVQKTKEAPPVKKIIQKTETSTININNNTNFESKLREVTEYFCSDTTKQCQLQCYKWLNEQKRNLKGKVQISSCDNGRIIYGEEHNCSKALCIGKVSFTYK